MTDGTRENSRQAQVAADGIGKTHDRQKSRLTATGKTADRQKSRLAAIGKTAGRQKSRLTGIGKTADRQKSRLTAIGKTAGRQKSRLAAIGKTADRQKWRLTGIGKTAGRRGAGSGSDQASRGFDAGEERGRGAELVAIGQTAPRGVGEAEAGFLPLLVHLPVQLIEDPLRRLRQDGRKEDGDDAEGLGEVVEDGVEMLRLGWVFGQLPRSSSYRRRSLQSFDLPEGRTSATRLEWCIHIA